MPSFFGPITNKKLDKRLLIDNVLKKIVECDSSYMFCFSETTKTELRSYNNDPDPASAEKVKTLWKSILMDSISFLKINDEREKLYISTKKLLKKENGEINFQEKFNNIPITSSFGIDEIDKYFDEFVAFEKVLYGTIDSYRSHVEHVIQVWAIGLALIDYAPTIFFGDEVDCLDLKFSFEHTAENKLFITKGEVFAMWSIIALCHDLGYPIEKVSKINTPLKRIINHFGSVNISEFDYTFSNLNNSLIEKFLTITSSKPILENGDGNNSKSGRTAIQSKYKDKIAKSLEDYKHGSYSALLIFKTLTYFLETDIYYENNENLTFEDTRQFLIRREILRSICGHTCPKLYHLHINTLPFLLILSDELQEFGRPRFNDNQLSFSSVNEIKCKLVHYKFAKKEKGFDVTIGAETQYKGTPEIKSVNCKEVNKGLCDDNFSSLKSIVKDKFKMFHHLLRSAKDDKSRTICFTWKISFGRKIEYIFIFNSKKSAFDAIDTKFRCKEDRSNNWQTFNIYD